MDHDVEKQYDEHYGDTNYKHITTLTSLLHEVLEYHKSGNVLDIGAGPGQNSIFLAKNGFSVTAIDISNESLKQIKTISKNLPITVKKGNIKEMDLTEEYDVIMCARTLEHFTKNEREKLFSLIKKHTRKGGVNLISAYITTGNETEVSHHSGITLQILPIKELKNIYKDWNILGVEEKNIVHKNKDEPVYIKAIQTILVQNSIPDSVQLIKPVAATKHN